MNLHTKTSNPAFRLFPHAVLSALLTVALLMPAVASAKLVTGLPDFSQLVNKTSPAVVNISTTQIVENRNPWMRQRGEGGQQPGTPFDDFFRHFFGMPYEGGPEPEQKTSSLGSGFIISEDGYILTNHHVVDGADEIIVKLNDQRELEAEIIGSDQRSDVALIKVDAKDLPTVKLGNPDDTTPGQWVVAIGSPFGFDATVTAGIVSAKGRVLGRQQYVPLIQTDVAINPGNSGGPLFNLDGEVIGINSMIYSRSGGYMGLSFAIPIDLAMNVVEQLREDGAVARGWLGVSLQPVDRDLAESFGLEKPMGALINEVFADSPADKAGVQPGDIVIRYDDKPVGSIEELPPMVGQTKVGDTVKVVVVRDRKEKTLNVTIGRLKDDLQAKQQSKDKDSGPEITRLGIMAGDLTPAQREQLELPDSGVVVQGIQQASPAAKAGVMAGDVILRFAGKKVDSQEQLRKLVEAVPRGRSVPVLVLRNKRAQYLAIAPADPE
ncbi:MAG: DegQ family serine endoprotease [Gammaproteobacteria bacterium]|nr:DegQ family serine endoprotease [Gammaproteobacteria bacterium]